MEDLRAIESFVYLRSLATGLLAGKECSLLEDDGFKRHLKRGEGSLFPLPEEGSPLRRSSFDFKHSYIRVLHGQGAAGCDSNSNTDADHCLGFLVIVGVHADLRAKTCPGSRTLDNFDNRVVVTSRHPLFSG